MKRIVLAVLLAALAVVVGACTSTRPVRVDSEIASAKKPFRGDGGQEIRGYTLINGAYLEFEGRVRLYSPDTLEFYNGDPDERTPPYAPRLVTRFRIPADSVQSVMAVHWTSAGKVLAVTAVVVLVAVAIVAAESCPFVYSYDGKQYVFDGEPYGGATMRALERTDLSELEHLVEVGGEYRLLVTNEVDEIQHTNSLHLLAVDHRPGAVVVMDREGRPHAFDELTPLLAAHDELGADLRTWLKATDHAAWYPDLKSYAQLDSIEDTRNHITLEFPRPKGVARAYLVTNVATGSWGSHMIRTMLGMRGRRVGEFYAAINGSEAARQQLRAWDAREELFELFPEVECGGTWERQDLIPGGGPYMSESRAIPLDLSRVEGDTLRVRINPPIGFWSLDSFQLAWRESEAKTTELTPREARGKSGGEIVAALGSDDGRYLDFPNVGDRAELVFSAPPVPAGMSRTVFARTRGWYEVNLHNPGDPDSAGIARLTFEPGYAVRRSLSEYSDFRRTDALLGEKEMVPGARR